MNKEKKVFMAGPFLLILFLISIPIAALAQVNIEGVISSTTTDPDALYATYYLRYVGNPPPPGYDPDHNYQWGAPQIICQPEISPVQFTGIIDVSEMPEGQVGMMGLLDSGLLEDGESGFMSGAYIYIYKTANDLRIGPTDGNMGGEIVQTYITILNEDIPTDGILPITLTIDGMVDPTLCNSGSVGPSATGCIYLDVNGYNRMSDSYGDVKALNSTDAYSWEEFEYGAHPGWDDYVLSNVGYSFALTGCAPVFKNLGQCISGLIVDNCTQLSGKDRAECNKVQIDYCQELFDKGK